MNLSMTHITAYNDEGDRRRSSLAAALVPKEEDIPCYLLILAG